MAKFRKKPVVIEAVQFRTVWGARWPFGVCQCSLQHIPASPHDSSRSNRDSLGWRLGDQEPDGEHYYPCKPDIFAATYEPVED